jgi:putative endonuclease
MTVAETHWFLYVLKCRDGSLYCGITTDLSRRLDQHNAGTGARYTRARRPVVVAHSWPCKDRSSALKNEAAFKKLSRAAKIRRLTAHSASDVHAPKTTTPFKAKRKA